MPYRFRCEFAAGPNHTGYVFSDRLENIKDGFWIEDFTRRRIASSLDTSNIFIPPSAILYIQKERH